MKPTRFLTTGVITLMLSVSAKAQLTWDISTDPGIQIGVGIWDTTNTNWTSDGGANNTSWTDGNAAVFTGSWPNVAGGTAVNLSGALTVNNITHTGTNGVRLVASAGNTLDVSGMLDVGAGASVTLAANGDNQFTGSFTKTGAGFLEINGSDTQLAFTNVTLNEGVIGFFGASGLQSETVALNGGAIGSITTVARSLDGTVTIGGNIGMGSGTGTGLSTGAINFGSAGTVNLGGATRTLTIGSDVNFNGVVSNGGITKEGAGRLTLSNIGNTLSGATVVNAGEFRVLSASAETGLLGTPGSGSATVNSGATLRFQTGSTSNAKSYATNINLNNATLAASDGIHTLTGNIALTGANIIEVQWGSKNLILTGAVSGSASISKTGAGDLIFGNGGTTGSLAAGIDVAINSGILAFNRSDAITLNNNLSGAGSLRNLGSGTTILTGNNTYGGSTNLIGGGTLVVSTVADAGGVGSLGTLSTAANSWLGVRENSTLRITGTGTQTTSRRVWNDAGTGAGTFDVVNAGASVIFTDTGGNIIRELIKTGAGAMTLTRQITTSTGAVTVNGGSLTLLGANTYSGETNVNAGTLAINNSLGSGSTVSVANGATLINNGTIAGAVTTLGSTSVMTGTGTFGGAVTIGGQLNPGNSPGYQAFNTTLTLGSDALTTFELGGITRSDLSANGINHYDAIDVTGLLTLDGLISIIWFGGYEATNGTTFNLLNWGSIDSSGFNLGTDLALPTFTDTSLSWDTSSFLSAGSIAVIPEPKAALLGGLGLLALLRRRRA